MPLPLRTVQPVYVSRGTLPERFPIQNDLEAVSNGTLSNVILQLSSLSHHAEELFSDLIRVGTEIATRASNLQARIDRLAVKVVQLDGAHEETASMQDSLNTKPFQSSSTGRFDQQVVSKESLPPNMMKTYLKCDKPPPLDNLNPYRDDGKDGLKFYTDPCYFFDLWRQEQFEQFEKKAIKKPHKPKDGGQRHKKRIRQPNLSRDRHKNLAIEHGEHIMNNTEYRPPSNPDVVTDGIYPPEALTPQQQQLYAQQQQQQTQRNRPLSIELKQQQQQPGYPNNYPEQNNYANNNGGNAAMMNNELNNGGQRHQYQYANANHYDQYSEAYNQHVLSQHQLTSARFYSQSHITPPPPYTSMPDGSPNAPYSTPPGSRGYGVHGRLSSTPSINNTSLTNGWRPNQAPPPPPPNNYGTPQNGNGTPTRSQLRMQNNSRDTLPPPPPPPVELETPGSVPTQQYNGHQQQPQQMYNQQQQMHSQHYSPQQQQHHYGMMDRLNSLPPPPPEDDDLPPPPPTPDQYHDRPGGIPIDDHLPPSPPPPPLDEIPSVAPTPLPNNVNNLPASNGNMNGGLIKPAPVNKKNSLLPAAFDGRSELLKAIRNGIELRKVDNKKEPKEEKGTTYGDVASILARRLAVEMSDSDSSSEENSDDGWDEASA